jgi:GDP-L-fucose synthase
MKLLVAGSAGMVGSAVCRVARDTQKFVIVAPTRDELDLLNQQHVYNYIKKIKPDCIVMAAARVGGIFANNTYPAEFIYENNVIQSNLIHSAHLSDVQKLIFLGSSCIYPRSATQPISETQLLSGPLEPTNEPYAVAKIAGIKMCESYNRQYNRDYRSLMPTNLYGPRDNFHDQNSHVIPSLIKKFHAAKEQGAPEVIVWGTGKPKREFLYVDDLAEAILAVINCDKKTYDSVAHPSISHVNIGTGEDITIGALATIISDVVGYQGVIKFDTTKPDGMPRKCLNVERAHKLGWRHKTKFRVGLELTYDWFCSNQSKIKSN